MEVYREEQSVMEYCPGVICLYFKQTYGGKEGRVRRMESINW